MSRSIQEEILAVLYIMAFLVAFATGNKALGWILAVCAVIATVSAIYYGIKEAIEKRKIP
jgi:hypothetical protein